MYVSCDVLRHLLTAHTAFSPLNALTAYAANNAATTPLYACPDEPRCTHMYVRVVSNQTFFCLDLFYPFATYALRS